MIEEIGFISGMVLESITMFYAFRRKIAEANRAVAERDKVIAEKNKIIEEREKTIAEKDKLIAETELLGLDKDQKRIEVKRAHLALQDLLNEEHQKYQDAQQKLADRIDSIAKKVTDHSDASDARNRAIKQLTGEVIESFSRYLEKATVCYRDAATEIRAIFIHTEIIPFAQELNELLLALNDPSILGFCQRASQPVKLTHASFGAIQRCLAEMLPALLPVQRHRLERELEAGFSVFEGALPLAKDDKLLTE